MNRRIDNQPGYCYVIHDELQPGIYESMRVVARGDKFKVKSSYNNTITGEWSQDISSVTFNSADEAINAMENPESLGFVFGYGKARRV